MALRDCVQTLTAFLGGKWWAGIGVLVGVAALLVAVWIGSREPKPENPPEPENPLVAALRDLEDLDSNAATSYLNVAAGGIYRTARGVEEYREVVIGDGATVEIAGEETWTLNTFSLEIGENVHIVAMGDPGGDGDRGPAGTDGGRCGNGTDGNDGDPGRPGRAGANVLIQAIKLQLPASVVRVDTRGGRGGNGGPGGKGGSGGRGSRTDSCGGGDGGRGGDGGNAGAGGAGGDLIVRYVAATTNTEDEESVNLPRRAVAARFEHDFGAGDPGDPGAKGQGGAPGAGRGASILTFDAQPAGSRGNDGEDGDRAPDRGTSGAKEIEPVPSG